MFGLAQSADSAQACFPCHEKTTTTTYYQPVVTAYSPCGPVVQPTSVVPVTVTTTRKGLFGLRKKTTVTYGTPLPIAVVTPPPPVILKP